MGNEVSGIGKKVHKPPNKIDLIKQTQIEPSEEKKSQVADKVRGILEVAKIEVSGVYTGPFLSGVNVYLKRSESSKIPKIIKLLKANGAQKTDNRKEVILDGVVVNVDIVKLYYTQS